MGCLSHYYQKEYNTLIAGYEYRRSTPSRLESIMDKEGNTTESRLFTSTSAFAEVTWKTARNIHAAAYLLAETARAMRS